MTNTIQFDETEPTMTVLIVVLPKFDPADEWFDEPEERSRLTP